MAKVERPTAPEWKDTIGQTFKPGDLVAVAVINGRSPQMVIARVERINLTDSKGKRLVKSVRTGRKETRTRRDYTGPALPSRAVHRSSWRSRTESEAENKAYWREYQALRDNPANWTETEYEVDEYTDVQAVSITATPLVDGRGFYRSDNSRKWDREKLEWVQTDAPKVKAVTYMFPANMVKLPGHVTEESLATGERDADFLPRPERE